MKITSYNPDGSVQETNIIDSVIPEYIERFDEQHSFLNISVEEIEIINSRRKTFKKAMLSRRLTAAINHDFRNFIEASNMQVELFHIDFGSYMHDAESNPDIIAGDKVLSSILRIYAYRSLYNNVREFQGDKFFSKETCTEEEFLIYINKVEYRQTDEQGIIMPTNWISVIVYHAFKSAVNVRLRNENVNIETRFFISLQHLINRYYYSLRNMERTVSWMPDELKHQMYVLSAFVNKVDTNKGFHFSESLFYIKIINALYLMKEQCRGDLYRMMSIVLNHHPSLTGEKRILEFSEKGNSKTIEKEHEICFHDGYAMKRYGITDGEIFTLRLSSNGALLSTLQDLLKTIYKRYVEIYHDKWEGNVKTDARIYFSKLNPYHENWTAFYYHEVERYRPTNLSSSKYFEPQDCFFYLLCNNMHPDEELQFTKDVIADLIELLIKHPCDSEEGLYECMFKMNYIKKHIGSDYQADEAVNNAMRYIGCLFEPDSELIRPYYRVNIKQLIEQILSIPDIYKKMKKAKPNGFTGGFNLVLVYNILGLLNDKNVGIITRGCEELDNYINNYAIDKGFVVKKTERKSYINETDEIDKRSLGSIRKLIAVFLNKTLKGIS